MKNLIKKLPVMLLLMFSISCFLQCETAEAKVKLNTTSKTVKVGKTVKVKLLNNKKKVVWSVTSNNIKIAKKTKKYAKVKGVSVGYSHLIATVNGNTYVCSFTVKEDKNPSPNKDTNSSSSEDKNQEQQSSKLPDFQVEKKSIYYGNDVDISIENCSQEKDGVQIDFIIQNNSSKDYSISLHEYAVNGLMSGGNLYGSDVTVPAGMKGKLSETIKYSWFQENNITELKKFDLYFWAYYDDFKEWETEQITVSTDKDNGSGYYFTDGTKIYSDDNMEVYYISQKDNTYKFCLFNKLSSEKRWILDNCSVNGWAYDLGSSKYDLYSEPVLGNCYTTFNLPVESDFMEGNGISSITNITFDIEFEYDLKSEKISLDL